MKLKSASCQIAYWQDGKLCLANYLTGRRFSTQPLTLELIRYFFTPRTIQEGIAHFRSYEPGSVSKLVLQLIEAQLLLEYGSAACDRDESVRCTWGPWLPEGSFHFMVKDTPFLPREQSLAKRLRRLPSTRAPPLFKEIRGTAVVHLPPTRRTHEDAFFQTLHRRRTHRAFARGQVPLEQISELLQTTWGAHGYIRSNLFGKLLHKTSPSGGARHPVEVYLMALRIQGLERGIYHYHAGANRLARIRSRATPRLASAYCADQTYCSNAAALFIMTAVFARTMWKYGRARAYRTVLLDAGHLCQTFCLTATRLGLAPFSTAALRDSLIEDDLGLDGINESVLYIAGVGLPLQPQARRRAS